MMVSHSSSMSINFQIKMYSIVITLCHFSICVLGGQTTSTIGIFPGMTAIPQVPQLKTLALDGFDHCTYKCHLEDHCLAYTYGPQNTLNQCTLLRSKNAEPIKTTDKSMIYAVMENRDSINACPSNPCQNDGMCFDQVDAFICSCPVPFTGNHCEIDQTEMLILGGGANGASTNVMITYKPQTKSFIVSPETLVIGNHAFAAGIFNNRLFIERGANMVQNDLYDMTDLSHIGTFASPTARIYEQCGGFIGNRFYSCYGRDDSDTPQSECQIYEFVDDANIPVVAMSQPDEGRFGAACIFLPNHLPPLVYVFGGQVNSGLSEDFIELIVHNASIELEQHTSLPVALNGAAAVMFKGSPVLCGGVHSVYIAECQKYNWNTNNWEMFPPMVISRTYFELVNWGDDKILAFGGTNSGGYVASVELYDDALGYWALYDTMPQGRNAMRVLQTVP